MSWVYKRVYVQIFTPPPWHHGAGLPAPAEGVPTAFTCMSYNVLMPNSSWDLRGKNGDEDLHPV